MGEGAYANRVLPGLLDRSGLDGRDRALATELAYGTVRMRRACDHLLDRFLLHPPDPATRDLLRLGAYQLAFLDIPAHAAVAETVDLAPRRVRGLANAVLRRVSALGPASRVDWPDDPTRLSYPDWIVERLTADLGPETALAALEQMNQAPAVTTRSDGYVQDLASQWVSELVAAGPGDLVADTCAGPGGKATAMAAAGATVLAGDRHPGRAGAVRDNARRLGVGDRALVVVADGAHPPLRPARFDRVLVDAPCSGLGVLRRRPDARWRVEPDAPDRLARLQQRLLAAARTLLRPGGLLVYSVCTLTAVETLGIDGWLAAEHPDLRAEPGPEGGPWRPWGRGSLLVPQAAGTDGMFVLRLRAPGGTGSDRRPGP